MRASPKSGSMGPAMRAALKKIVFWLYVCIYHIDRLTEHYKEALAIAT